MKTMYDVIERTREALDKDENIDFNTQSYADETQNMIANERTSIIF